MVGAHAVARDSAPTRAAACQASAGVNGVEAENAPIQGRLSTRVHTSSARAGRGLYAARRRPLGVFRGKVSCTFARLQCCSCEHRRFVALGSVARPRSPRSPRRGEPPAPRGERRRRAGVGRRRAHPRAHGTRAGAAAAGAPAAPGTPAPRRWSGCGAVSCSSSATGGCSASARSSAATGASSRRSPPSARATRRTCATRTARSSTPRSATATRRGTSRSSCRTRSTGRTASRRARSTRRRPTSARPSRRASGAKPIALPVHFKGRTDAISRQGDSLVDALDVEVHNRCRSPARRSSISRRRVVGVLVRACKLAVGPSARGRQAGARRARSRARRRSSARR